ncbi:MAG: GNAT family N-acetyltransferase [Acidimicrobiales bacterium]
MRKQNAVVDPPEVVDAGAVLLRRAVVHDAEALATAVAESLEHLRPWLPWATPEAASVAAQTARLSEATWGPDDYGYLMVTRNAEIVGGSGLHRRVGPTSLEIGYWVHVRHVRRGYAAAAAAALTRTALCLPGIERVEIHCDEANVASAGVARRIGYELDGVVDHPIDSPAQTGRFMIWRMTAPVSSPARRSRPIRC